MALTKAHNRMIEGSAVNVKDFGAVGDGVTDDTAAIQAAVDAAYLTHSAVYFPAGEYYVTSSIELRSETNISDSYGTWLIGSGLGSKISGASGITVIKGYASGPSDGSMFDFCGLVDLMIGSSNPSSKAAVGFDISEMTRLFVQNVVFKELDYGIKQTAAASPTDQCWSNSFFRCIFQSCDEWAVYIENSYDIKFVNCMFEASASDGGGISLTDNTTLNNIEYRNFRIMNCTFQNLYKSAIEGGAGLSLNIENCYFEDCALGGSGNGWSYEIDLTKGNRDTSGFVDSALIRGNTFNTQSSNQSDSNFYNIGVEKVINSAIWHTNYTNNSRRVEVTNSTSSDSLRVDANLSSTEVSTGSAIVYGIDDTFQYATGTEVVKQAVNKALRQIKKSDNRELTVGYSSSKPSTSDHRKGSIYFNDAIDGSSKATGWICIAEGSPDTWKTLITGGSGSTAQRDALSLAASDKGALFYNETTSALQYWSGSAWSNV